MRMLLAALSSILLVAASAVAIWKAPWRQHPVQSQTQTQRQSAPIQGEIAEPERQALLQGIILVQNADEPSMVVEVGLAPDRKNEGDLRIQIKNATDKPIKTLSYWLAPMPCRQYRMPNLLLDYGDRSLLDKGHSIPSDPILAPGQRVSLALGGTDLRRYLDRGEQVCSKVASEKPHLFLAKVYFVDGTEWDISKQPLKR